MVTIYIVKNGITIEKKYINDKNRIKIILDILQKYHNEIYVEDKNRNRWKTENYLSQETIS